MASTYTTNIGIEKPATGDQSGTWGETTNTNFDIIDQGTNGVAVVTLAVAGTSGSPNSLPISNGALSDGRNRFIEFNDGADLGATAYVQLDPNDAEKIVHIRNSLSGSRSLILFQGTYNASNDFEVPNGADVLVKFDGGGTGATVTDVNVNLTPTKVTTGDLDVDNININGNTISSTDTNGNLTIDPNGTGDIVLDANVGIGTSSPYSYGKLTIEGGNGTQLVLDNAGEQYTQMYFLNNGTDKGSIWVDNSLSLFSFTARSGMGMNFYVNNSERMRITSTGNVGIGTTGPSFTTGSGLEIERAGAATLRIEDTGSGGKPLEIYSDDGEGYVINGVSSGMPMIFKNNNTEAMRIDSSGNVGIGGTATANGAGYTTFGVNGSTAGIIEHQANGVRQAQTYATTSAFTTGSITAIPMTFGTGNTERMRIDQYGNVGIGTSSPIVNTTGTVLHINNGTVSEAAVAHFTTATSGSGAADGLIVGKWSDDTNYFFDYDSNNIVFGNNNTERLRINTAGQTYAANVPPQTIARLIGRFNGASIEFGHGNNSGGYYGTIGAWGSSGYPYIGFSADCEESVNTFTTRGFKGNLISGDNTGSLIFSQLTNASATGQTPAERMRITTAGFVGIGTSSPTSALDVRETATSAAPLRLETNGGAANTVRPQISMFSGGSNGYHISTIRSNVSNDPYGLAFIENTTERMRIDSSGNLLVGTTTNLNNSGVTSMHGMKGSTANRWVLGLHNAASSSPWGIGIDYTGAAPNNTSQGFLYCADTSAVRFDFRSNGGIANFSANNVNLSDERVKTDIAPIGSYWDKIKAVEVVTFKYKDQTHDDDNIGVIAQQVESVAPEFVSNDGFGETPEDGVPLKSVYEADLHYATLKALQEAMARIETLEARVAALEA